MSIIQSIRERGALISAIVIAVSLIGFILMDAFSGRGRIFGNSSRSTAIGVVNGKKINYTDFDNKIKEQELRSQQQGYSLDEASKQQLIQQTWTQEVNEAVMRSEFQKAGLHVGKKELNDIIYNNPGDQIVQQFTDKETGIFNAAAYQQQVMQMKNSKAPQDQAAFAGFVDNMEYSRMLAKFNSMVAISSYFPKWFLEKQNEERSQMASISYVSVPLTTVADSSISVTDKEIEEYVSKHKDDFKRTTESRSIEYVAFDAAPTSGDSAAVKKQLDDIKQSFADASDDEAFVNANYSELGYFKSFVKKSAIQAGPYNDSVAAVGVGKVFGPFVFGKNYELAKLVKQAVWPDTVKVRHILIATEQRDQSGQSYPIRDDSTAKKLADSIQGAIAKGSNFDSLCIKFSDDQGSKEKGGVYENVVPGQMVSEFNDYIFSHSTGSKDVVKTDFGYHYIEILSQKGSSPVYQVAYITKPIVASKETDQGANAAATKFAGDSRSYKAFTENWEKELKPKGINKGVATVGPNDFSIGGLGVSRNFVRDVYKADKGDVMDPEMIGDKYVVAVITAVDKPGLMSAAEARPMVEPLLRNEKKAEQIVKNIGSYSSLEEASTKTNFPVQQADSIRFSGGYTQLNNEPKLIGAIFNPANNGKLVQKPVKGDGAVFVVKVNNITATAVETANIEQQREMLRANAMRRIEGGYGNYGYGMQEGAPQALLRKLADIKDNRPEFY